MPRLRSNQGYDALKCSVYAALLLQTRLKPYLNTIQLNFDDTGFRFDTAAANDGQWLQTA